MGATLRDEPPAEVRALVRIRPSALDLSPKEASELASAIRASGGGSWVAGWKADPDTWFNLCALAIRGDCPAVLDALLAAGADCVSPVVTDSDVGCEEATEQLLQIAIGDCRECVPILLRAGADPNLPRADQTRLSPLHSAVHKDAELVQWLLEAGADPLASSALTTPIEEARRAGDIGRPSLRLLRAAAMGRGYEPDGPAVRVERPRRRRKPALPAYGASAFARPRLALDLTWSVWFSRTSVSELAEAIADVYDGCRVEHAAHERALIADEAVAVYRLKGTPWTLAPRYAGNRFAPSHRTPGMAVEISRKVADAVHTFVPLAVHTAEGGAEREPWVFAAAEEDLDDASPNVRATARTWNFEQLDACFEQNQLLIPPGEYRSDGLELWYALERVAEDSVEEAAMVVLRELDLGNDAT